MLTVSLCGRRLVAFAFLCCLAGVASTANAATRTWTGAAAPDTETGIPANWSGGLLPQNGDDLVFPAGASQLIVTNTLNVQYRSMTFAANAGQTYYANGFFSIADHIAVDSGNATFTTGGGLQLVQIGMAAADIPFTAAAGTELAVDAIISGSALATVHTNGAGRVTFGGGNNYAGATIIESGTLRVRNDLALGVAGGSQVDIDSGATLELDDPNGIIYHPVQFSDGSTLLVTSTGGFSHFFTMAGNLTINVADNKTLSILSLAKGPGTFTKTGPGDLTFGGAVNNTFGAGTPATVNAGTVHLNQHNGAQGFSALLYGVTINGGQVIFTASNQIGGAVVVNSGGHLLLQDQSDYLPSLAGQAGGTVDINGGALTLGSVQFAGPITGTGTLNLQAANSSSAFLLSGTSTFTGTTNVNSPSQLQVTGTLPGPIVLTSSGLNGTGIVGTVTGTIGTVLPGTQGGGTLHTQSLSLMGGAFILQAFQTAGGAVWAKVAVTGTVTLGNDIVLDPIFDSAITAVAATPIVIIDNDGSDPVIGTFKDLPEGGSFVDHGITYHISYQGGDGNDVVLIPTATQTTPPKTYYLSEGSTGGFFSTDVLIANPTTTDAPVTLTFYTQANGVVTKDITVPALQRVTVTLNALPELGDGAVSTTVTSTSGAELVVERTMSWDKSGYGASGDKAVDAPATTWYFAEGSQGFFSTYLLLANPQMTANSATVTYYREFEAPVTRTYPLDPQSRTTIDLGTEAALFNRSFGMRVQFAQPGVAERSMYFGTTPFWKGGHESAGVTAPSLDWLLAEGATGPFFETFILLANPNPADAEITVTFLPQGGSPVMKAKTIPANGRLTINIEGEDPSLANAAVATQVHASVPIVAERSQYWPDPAPQWYEAHNDFGITAPGTKWGLAEGRVGQTASYQSFILLANPGQTDAIVTIQFLREHGGAPLTKSFSVRAASRLNVAISGPGSDVPELVDENFGAIITSDQPIAVERSMYASANGLVWAAGTNAAGSVLK